MSNSSEIKDYIHQLSDIFLKEEQLVKIRLKGYSMFPCIKNGDIGTIQKCNFKELEIGDIVVFSRGKDWIAHRIIKFIEKNSINYIATKGDSEKSFDKLIDEKNFVGKIVLIERDSKIIFRDSIKQRQKNKKIAKNRKLKTPLIRLILFFIINYHNFNRIKQEFVETNSIILKKSRKLFYFNFLLSIIQGIAPFAVIYLLKLIVDKLTNINDFFNSNDAYNTILILIIITGVFFLIQLSVSTLIVEFRERFGQSITKHIASLVQKKYTDLDIERLENSEQQDTIHRGIQESGYRPVKIINDYMNFSQSIISLVVLIILLLKIHWLVFIMIFISAIPEFIIRIWYSRKLYKFTKTNSQKEREIYYYNYILTSKTFAKELRLFDIERYFTNKFKNIQNYLFKEKNKINSKRTIFVLITQIFTISLIFITFGIITDLAIKQLISIGTVVLFFLIFQRGFSVMKDLFQSTSNIVENHIFFKDFKKFIKLEKKFLNSISENTLQPIEKEVFVDNISFKYPSSKRETLFDVSFSIPKGKITALVGANGSGKSTIIKLLCGFYQPTKGNIYFDNQEISNYKSNYIREQITAVFQDFALYNISASQNIALGDINKPYDFELIKQAAQKADINQVLEQLPNSYNTVLGNLFEKGEDLSVGQWQKIAIAKAFYRNSNILLLDEPSSALDIETEINLFEKLKTLSQNKAVLLVTHRLTSLNWVDNIIVLENGTIVEQGTQNELINRKGKFFEMYNKKQQV